MLRYLVFAGLLLAICSSQSPRSASAEELINWYEDLPTARQISQQYKVPILVHFYGDQCMPCRTLEKNVFTRPEVASTMQRYFVPVRINATRDRKTAAEFGVHSWPTDVFVSPDGKTLSQGVCNQNANAYLQNLQAMAIMNRDRNAMLAASPAAPQSSPASAYGRTASNNLQQSAPGRDQAPSPYSNPSSGSSPYASQGPASSLGSAAQGTLVSSTLPSPAFQGQTAMGQAQNGQVNAGPLSSSNTMTTHPSAPGTSLVAKDANLPPSIAWQNPPAGPATSSSLPAQANQQLSTRQNTGNSINAATAPAPMVAANVPVQTTDPRLTQSKPATAVVDNPHYGASTPVAQGLPNSQGISNSQGVPSQLASFGSSGSKQVAESKPTASVPALSGYCPVELIGNSQWVEGSTQYAIRHRGRVYFLSSEENAKKFLANPDAYSPVLSGHDPLIFLREGKLVEGSIYDGVLKDETRILLFSSQENKKLFYDNYDRMIVELDAIIAQSKAMTASRAGASVTR